jgi:hypothetical protein
MNLFPIGHYVGERQPEGLHYVRVGMEHQTMTPDEFGVWVLTHTESPVWTDDDVLALADKAELPAAAEALARLTSVGAVASAADEQAFARRYRLMPLLVGLGNTEAHPDTYTIGLPGSPAARVNAGSYELWQWSALAPTLWHTCEVRAKVTEDPVSAAELVADVLAETRPLLANSCAYLDLAGTP